MSDGNVVVEPVEGKSGRAEFVDIGRAFAAREPHAVPQLRSEQLELVDPNKNPFFGHASHQLFVARRGGVAVGRISAHIDHLALELPREQGFGPGAGMFGYFDAADEAVAHALLRTAEDWLRSQGMDRAIGPISMSIWEEPGLLVKGQDHDPMIMMGHHPAAYQHWIESAGYVREKTLLTYHLDVTHGFPPLIQRIVQSGQRNDRITVRPIDISRWDEEVETLLTILNDAWSNNWGFVPFTNAEIAYAGKKLKPIIHPELNMVAELDGKPVAFMLTFPDVNGVLRKVKGRLLPFGWFHGEPAGFHDDQPDPRNRDHEIRHHAGRDRLDPRRQPGDEGHRRCDPEQRQPRICDLPQGARDLIPAFCRNCATVHA